MIKNVHSSNFPLPDKNILMISYNSFLQKFYQTLPAEISKQSGAGVKILVPPYWKELWSNGKIYLEKSSDPGYEIVVGKTAFTGNLHFAVFRNQLIKLLKKFQPHIIDLENEPFNAGTFQLVFYSKFFSPYSKIVLHASQNKYKSYPPPFNLFEEYTLKHADAILVRNSAAKDVLEQKGYKGRLELITHGVDTEAFKPQNISNQDKDTSSVIGYVGSLVEQKGINYLFKAVQSLPCKLLIVGNGPEKESLVKLSRDLQIDVQFELNF